MNDEQEKFYRGIFPATGVPLAVSLVRVSLPFLGLRDLLPFLVRVSMPFFPALLPTCCLAGKIGDETLTKKGKESLKPKKGNETLN